MEIYVHIFRAMLVAVFIAVILGVIINYICLKMLRKAKSENGKASNALDIGFIIALIATVVGAPFSIIVYSGSTPTTTTHHSIEIQPLNQVYTVDDSIYAMETDSHYYRVITDDTDGRAVSVEDAVLDDFDSDMFNVELSSSNIRINTIDDSSTPRIEYDEVQPEHKNYLRHQSHIKNITLYIPKGSVVTEAMTLK